MKHGMSITPHAKICNETSQEIDLYAGIEQTCYVLSCVATLSETGNTPAC